MPSEDSPSTVPSKAVIPPRSEPGTPPLAAYGLDLSSLFRLRPFFLAMTFVNLVFLLWFVTYGTPSVQSRGPLLLAFHASIVLIIKVLPGLTTALLLRKRYRDAVHFGAYLVMLSVASVLAVKLVINALPIPINAQTFAGGLFIYINGSFLLARHRWAEGDRSQPLVREPAEAPVAAWLPRRSRVTDVAAVAVLCSVFVFTDFKAAALPQIPDLDFAGFSTYSVMHWTVPGSGYYEETASGRHIYPNYTPFLKYDFSHPPLACFDTAYAATLGGFLEYSKKFYRPLVPTQDGDLYNYSDLNPSRLYMGMNRTMALYHCVLVAALIYLLSFRLTHNSWLSLAVMLTAIGLFSRPMMLVCVCISVYKAPFMLYSLLALYCYLYMEDDRRLAFAVSLTGSLVNQKFVYAVLAILTIEVFRSRWRVLWNPFGIGFFAGTVAFIIYGLLVDVQVFISMYFVRHLYDRLFAEEDSFERVAWAWRTLLVDFVPIWPTILFAGLSGFFAVKKLESKKGVLFTYFLWAVLLGTKQRHCNPRYLVPALLSTILMGAWSANYLLQLIWRIGAPKRHVGDALAESRMDADALPSMGPSENPD